MKSTPIQEFFKREKKKFHKKRRIRKRDLAIPVVLITATTIAIGSIAVNKTKNDRVENYIENGTTEYRKEEQIEPTTELTTEATTAVTTEATTVTTENTTNSTTEEIFESDYISSDKVEQVTDWFWTINNGIDEVEETFMNEDKQDEVKSEAKEKIIEYTDFIFYGTEIDGKTFEELTEEEKSKIYTKYQELINTVNEYDPDYIDSMSDKYKVIKDFGSLTFNNAKNIIKEKVGEDYYNSATEAGEAIKNGAKDTGSFALEYLKDKYENWRDNNSDE